MALKHTFASAKSDGADATLVQASNWNADHVPDADGIKMTAGTTDPATPAAGFVNFYAKKIADRCMPKWVGPAGVDTPVQSCLGMNRMTQMAPAGGTASTTVVQVIGPNGGWTAGGTTFAQPALATTNLQTSLRRCTLATSATAGTLAYLKCTALECWKGNAAGLGGFFFVIRFGLEGTVQTGMRVFAGLSDSVAVPTNVDPTTSTTIGKVGLAINASTGNWNLVTNLAAVAPTVTGLGASFPVNNTSVLELVLFMAPNGTTIGYRVTNLSTAATTSGTLSSNLPATTSTFLAPMYWGTNNATAAVVTLGFGKWYLESDD